MSLSENNSCKDCLDQLECTIVLTVTLGDLMVQTTAHITSIRHQAAEKEAALKGWSPSSIPTRPYLFLLMDKNAGIPSPVHSLSLYHICPSLHYITTITIPPGMEARYQQMMQTLKLQHQQEVTSELQVSGGGRKGACLMMEP